MDGDWNDDLLLAIDSKPCAMHGSMIYDVMVVVAIPMARVGSSGRLICRL
jgi:hypothetical protein